MHPALQILAAAAALEKAGQRTFRRHGLTVAQFNVLNLLADQPAGLRASDLAAALIVDRSNVTGLLKRMYRLGFLKAVDSVHDRRQHVVTLSAKGRAAWAAAHPAYQQGLDAVAADWTPAQRAALEKALQSLIARADQVP